MTGQQGAGKGNFRTAAMVLATMTTGLLAGVFVNWSNTVMPGLREVDDRTFVAAFRELDAAISNPLFLGLLFMGSLLFTALAVGLHFRAGQRKVLQWAGAALVCTVLVCVITFGVHEPLNQDLRTATEPGSDADPAAVRDRLDESLWTAWNTVRALASTVAFGCLAWALVILRTPERLTARAPEQPVSGPGTQREDTRPQ